jgi:hypothetical protein
MQNTNASGSPAWAAEVLHHARLSRLLRDADEARALLQRSSRGASDVQQALDSIHRDLGRALHELVSPAASHDFAPPLVGAASFGEEGGTVFPTQASANPLSSPVDPLYDDDWYTEEKQNADAPLFADGELTDDDTDVPEAEPFLTRKRQDAVVEPPHQEVLALERLMDDAVDPSGDLAALRSDDPPAWLAELNELLALVAPPRDLVDVELLPEEASKVQWAAGELDVRLPRLPERVQLAVLGLLAARCRNLQAHLDLDLGPRKALDRLRRYRQNNDLPWVRGLVASMGPESDSWADDALSYWLLLRPEADRG